MKIALVKTSSMGDVIHALPVVSDIVRAVPGARIDWIVEEAFADLPALHPAVADIVPVAIRRWRKSLFSRNTRNEITALRRRLRGGGYDVALDLQGLVKSAWVARMAGAPVWGFSRRCAREPLASLAYRRSFDVDLRLHAIERLRSLAAQAFAYQAEALPSFGLAVPDDPVPGLPEPPYVLLLHATSRESKQWPQAHWQALISGLAERGIASALPWGSEPERLRAEMLAATPVGPQARVATVLPRLSLRECAAAIARAEAVVGVDTGLTHLATAIDVPTVALFAATPAWRFGPYWSARAVSLGEQGAWPQVEEVMQALERVRGARA